MTNPQYHVKLYISVSSKMHKKLKQLAKRHNISLSEYVRKTMEEKMAMEGFALLKDIWRNKE